MNKEQEIKKIEEILGDCNKNICRIENTCEHCKAKILYNAGYRKQSEVAKEVLKKLKHELEKEKFNTIEQSAFDNAIEHAQIIVDETAKEYGVKL